MRDTHPHPVGAMDQDSPKQAMTAAEKAARRAKNAANRAKRAAKAEAQPQAAPDKSANLGQISPIAEGKPAKTAKMGKKPAGATTGSAKISRDSKNSDNRNKSRQIPFNILIVAQSGRLEHEAVLFAETLRANAPDWTGRLIVAEPQEDGAWSGHKTQISAESRAALQARGAEIRPFTAQHFGAAYPYGNKIEALSLLPPGENFIFFDTDTLITGPLDKVDFDFTRPSASMRREGTWPEPPLYGPGYGEIWRSLYDRFGLDYASSLDLGQPDEHWERHLYFNAGWFFGADPAVFGQRFLDWALAVRDDPGEALASQSLDPWLDQIVLPLVIHSLGGGRPGPAVAGLDGDVTCHWRNLPLLYARESDAAVDAMERAANAPDIKPLLEGWEPAARLIYQQNGSKALRPAIDRDHLPLRERALRQDIKRAGWWVV